MLHVEPSGDGEPTKITFDILMQKDKDPREMTSQLAKIEGISEVVLVASKNDVDY
jgi:ribose 5-phosphate isomerase